MHSDFASIFTTPPSLIDNTIQMQLCSWLSASILWVYVRMDKELSLLYGWHLLKVWQAKYLFSTMFLWTNIDCDVTNALWPKAMIFGNLSLCVSTMRSITLYLLQLVSCTRPVLLNLFCYGEPLKVIYKLMHPIYINSCTLFSDTSPCPPHNCAHVCKYPGLNKQVPLFGNSAT